MRVVTMARSPGVANGCMRHGPRPDRPLEGLRYFARDARKSSDGWPEYDVVR